LTGYDPFHDSALFTFEFAEKASMTI